MPKKHQRFHFKPSAQAHHSLALGSNQNGAPGASGGSTTSVNDLISHLRRTQPPSSSEDGIPRRPQSTLTPRSVHPSLRNLLEIPETQPPRPRPLSYRTAIGARPVRPTVGPPPPESWLSARTDDEPNSESLGDRGTDMETIIYRLKRLPGTKFPDNGSLMHLVLKKMALNWAWHLEYDGAFLSELPNNLKCLLLSYIAVFARGQPLDRQMKGLSPLFSTQQDRAQSSDDESEFEEIEFDRDVGTTRLDLGGAVGNWMSFKRLTNELINLHSSPMHAVRDEREEYIPNSWDEVENSGHDEAIDEPTHATYAPSIPKQLTRKNRFENLRFLSLAHPKRAAASWTSLIKLLSRLPTITHLSLAHWPTPTRTPGAVNARIRHPTIHSLTFSYSGTDNYASLDNAWAEAASVLRHLSRSTRCLQWLDLEGCADWLPALNWVGEDPNGVPYRPGSVGPDWNGSWRDVGWISLGPGWIPNLDDNKDMSHRSQVLNPDPADPPWRAEEQANARRLKKLGAYREQFQTALAVRKNLRLIRKEGRGKWLQVSLGLDDVDPQIVRQLVGQDYALHE
ncbi:hypothetical protein MYU51_020171 [Penicillium brevicompactum]|uniref:uncharacterized protein n=1 Tax=Penicillium brevicompactum TaxID=5074 RepID=UPI0025404D82|nr:uncharacterized protein N7506_003984 [Penicillium brevicompactum]KAJ5335962.1 hypothetical protein N7506_003984 [Penicillium brevicompactum]